jgi:hypothetical protein
MSPDTLAPPDERAVTTPAGGTVARRHDPDALTHVRASDIEPYIGLRYLSKLFRVIAIIIVLLLIAEVVTGLARQGADAIPTLVAEASRLIVLAGLLWGIGDLAILLIDVGHDLRAARILIGRLTSHLVHHPNDAAPAPSAESRGTTP